METGDDTSADTPLREEGVDGGRGAGVMAWFWAALERALLSLAAACGLRRIVRFDNGRSLVIDRKLADGGFSFVYLCTQLGSGGRKFALKEMLSQCSEQRDAVRAEIDVLRSLAGKPNIEPLLDFSFERLRDGVERAFLLFPFHSAGSLQDRVNGGALFSEPETLSIVIGLCRALGALVALDPPRAHRDLCPRNVMLSDDGKTPLLIDFGSVRPARVKPSSRNEAMQLMEDAQAHSSPPYRAPELWDPVTGTAISEKSDVWSLGSTAYCLAFGFSPNESFRGEDGRLRIAEPSQLRALGTVMFPTASDRLPVRIRDAASSAALPSAATAPPAAVSASGHPFSSDFCALLTAMMSTDDAARPSVGEVAVRAAALLRHGVR